MATRAARARQETPPGPKAGRSTYEEDFYAWAMEQAAHLRAGRADLLDFENIAGVPAAVRDSTSTYGLRFAGEKPAGKLKLAFSRDARTGKSCEVVWRRGKTVGVKFVR